MTTLTTFLDHIHQFPQTSAFRGQADGSWELQSAATRRLNKHVGGDVTRRMDYPRVHASYHVDELIEPARTAGFDVEDGYKLSDLELLAKLQHFGAATGLIDFSWNPLVALWFACSQIAADKNGGKVFVVDLNDPSRFERVSHNVDERGVGHLFPPANAIDKPLYWEPTVVGAATERILRQRSVFVIARPLIPDSAFHVIDIAEADKEPIRRELEARLDVSAPTLFVDIHGFSAANNAHAPIRRTGEPRLYLFRANQLAQQGQYAEAIGNYDRCIQLASDVREPYFLRGNAKAALRDYLGAKEDYDFALARSAWPYHNVGPNVTIVNDPDLSVILFNRGNVRAAAPQPDYEGALKGYDDAIKHQVFELGAAVLLNRGNVKANMGRLDDSLEDYDKAAELGSQAAQFNKGNILVKLGRFEEAQECYAELSKKGYSRQQLADNTVSVERIVNRIGRKDFKATPEQNGILHVRVHGDDQNQQAFLICGNVGNTGNTGGANLPGGEGFDGAMGFVVIVEGQT